MIYLITVYCVTVSRELTLLRESTQKGNESSPIEHHALSLNKRQSSNSFMAWQMLFKQLYKSLTARRGNESKKEKGKKEMKAVQLNIMLCH